MRIEARPGSLKARLFDVLGWLLNLAMPGSVEAFLECDLCGERVDQENADNHTRYFHPEEYAALSNR